MAEGNDSGNITEETENLIFKQEFKTMYLPTCYTLFFIGFVGNICSLIVWTKGTRCRNLQCSMYFKILALSDILVLTICVGIIPTLYFIDVKIRKGLLALWFAQELGPEISPWIIVTLSIERALSMMFPLKFTGQFAKRRALIAFGCIIVVLVLLQFIWVFSVQFKNDDYNLTTASAFEMAKRIKYLKMFILCAVPLCFVIICNALIAYRLFRMRKLGSVTNGSQRNRRLATFTILTIVTGILHFISTLPTVLMYIALADAYTASPESLSQKWYRGLISNPPFWTFIAETTIYINNSFNFYVYCLVGRDFRADLIDILCCRNRELTGRWN